VSELELVYLQVSEIFYRAVFNLILKFFVIELIVY
jgi:hypothetical protein